MEKRGLDRLFKPFAQANARVSAKYGGAGLGLSITRSLACAMGGDVDAQSALGKGSVFTLRLPAARVQRKPVAYTSNTRTFALPSVYRRGLPCEPRCEAAK